MHKVLQGAVVSASIQHILIAFISFDTCIAYITNIASTVDYLIPTRESTLQTPTGRLSMALSDYNRAQIIRRLTEGESIRTIATAIGCGISTVQRIKKEHSISSPQMNTPAKKMNTPNTKKLTPEEYAAHRKEEYDPFKHGFGAMRTVEVP